MDKPKIFGRRVALRCGCMVPIEALCAAWAFEARGFTLELADSGCLQVEPSADLTDEDVDLLRRHKRALGVIVAHGDWEATA